MGLPFVLCRRLHFVLLPSSQGRRWLYTPWRRVTTTLATINHFTTNSLQLSHYRRSLPQPILQPSRCRRTLPQPVYSHRAADELYHNQSTASRCRRPLLQLVYSIALQTTPTTTSAPQAPQTHSRRRRRQLPQYHNTTIPQYHNTTIPQYHNTTIPQYNNTTIPRFHNTKIPFHRRCTVGYCAIDNYYNIGILQMRR